MRIRRLLLPIVLAGSLAACGGSDNVSSGTPAEVAVSTSDSSGAASGDDGGIEGLETFEIPTPKHTEAAVTYEQSPPVGGDHFPGWLNCGAYAEPQPNEQAVHSMEHGAVWITYDPALDAGEVAKLQAMTKNQTHLLVTPYPGLTSPVVASAWGLQVALDGVDDPRLATFIEKYQNGPQTLEPGAPCSGALGTPL